MTDFDDATDLRRVMQTALADLHPDAGRLHASARAEGRSLRRRRRAWTGAAALGLATVVGTAGVVVLGGGTSTAGDGFAIEPTPTTVTTAATAAPTSSISGPGEDPAQTRTAEAGASFPMRLGGVDLPAREMLRRLRPLLPATVTVTRADVTNTDIAPGDDPRRFGNLLVALDRAGQGRRGGLEVVLYAAPPEPLPADDPDVTQATSCPATDLDDVAVTECHELTDAAGEPNGRSLAYTDDAFVVREVVRRASDGSWVAVADANSVDQKWGTGYAALPGEPPLSLDELLEIAADPTWIENP